VVLIQFDIIILSMPFKMLPSSFCMYILYHPFKLHHFTRFRPFNLRKIHVVLNFKISSDEEIIIENFLDDEVTNHKVEVDFFLKWLDAEENMCFFVLIIKFNLYLSLIPRDILSKLIIINIRIFRCGRCKEIYRSI